MRKLTLHEKKLTLFLGAAVGVGIHLIFLKLALDLDRGNRRNLATAQDELVEARGWMEQKEIWTPRAEWLEKNFPPVPSDNPAPALQKAAQSAALEAGLKIDEQNLRPPRTGTRTTLYASKMRLSGSLEQFLKWLVAVYQPERGIAVTALSLKIGPEPPKMVGEAEVGQFFKPNNP
jgi:hypothetical protein